MKKRNLLLVMLAVLLAFGLVIGCDLDTNDDNNDDDDEVEDNVVPNTYRGVYSYTYDKAANGTGGTTETIELSSNTFNIWDTSKGAKDKTEAETKGSYLKFTITKWENDTTPDTLKDTYPNAFKFTGKILSQKDYVPSTYTVPNGDANDVKANGSGPDFIMYLYFDINAVDEDGNAEIIFLRSSFSKDGANKAIVSPTENRVYTKKK